jgi:hypothetical protein
VPLRLIYGYRRSLQVGSDDLEAYRRLSTHEQRRIRLLKGHVSFGVHEHCPGTARYFTLVREPVGQVDSFHRMLLDEYTRSQFSIESLEAYIHSEHRTYVPNRQLRMITGIGNDASVGPQALERAKDILDEYFVVAGVTERFDASVLLMKEYLDWSWPPFYVRSRTGSREKKRTIPDRVRRTIREQNAWDVRLHEYVTDQLESEIERRGDAFRRRVRRFQRLNRAFGAVARRPLQLFRTAREWGKERGLFSSLR